MVRGRVQAALRSLPDSASASDALNAFLASRSGGEYLSYFDCVEVCSLVKSCESGTRTLFGGYASEAVALWTDILAQFERDGLILADAADRLRSLAEYDLPMARRQMSAAQAQIESLASRETEARAQVQKLRAMFDAECQKLHIQPVVPPVLGADTSYVQDCLVALASDALPALFVTAAEALECAELRAALDFYRACAGAPVDELAHFAAHGFADLASDDEMPARARELLGAAEARPRSVSQALQASAEFRGQVVTDLIELECFLQQRLREARSSTGALVLRASSSSSAAEATPEALRNHLAAVARALEALNNPQLRNLLMLRNSSRNVQRTAAGLHARLLAAAKIELELDSFESKRAQARECIERNGAVVQSMLAGARALAARLAEAIASHFKGRRVEITGLQ